MPPQFSGQPTKAQILSSQFSQTSGISEGRLTNVKATSFDPTLRAGPGGPGSTDLALDWFGLPSGTGFQFRGPGSSVLQGMNGLFWESNVEATFGLLFEKVENSDDIWVVGASVNYPVEYDKWVEVGAPEAAQPKPYFKPALEHMMNNTFPSEMDKVIHEDLTINGALKEMAKTAERRMIRNTDKFENPTGNLEGSIAAVKTSSSGGDERVEDIGDIPAIGKSIVSSEGKIPLGGTRTTP